MECVRVYVDMSAWTHVHHAQLPAKSTVYPQGPRPCAGPNLPRAGPASSTHPPCSSVIQHRQAGQTSGVSGLGAGSQGLGHRAGVRAGCWSGVRCCANHWSGTLNGPAPLCCWACWLCA